MKNSSQYTRALEQARRDVAQMIQGRTSYAAVFEVCLALANCTSDVLAQALIEKRNQLHYELETWAGLSATERGRTSKSIDALNNPVL